MAERDEDGLLTAIILPSGRRLEITTNEDGHITKIATLGESALEYKYQGANLVSFTDANGGETRYEYDGQHRMTAWYDAAGNLTRLTDQFGNVTAYEYDADGNLLIERADSCSQENCPLTTLP